MHMPRLAANFAVVSLILSGCSQSDLDRCIDSQMAVWKQEQKSYEELVKLEPQYGDNETVNIGGVEVDKRFLGGPRSPGTKEEAEAQAILRCGKIYAKAN